MQIKPLGDKILVKRLEAQTQTASGIFLPESAKEKPQQAKVVAVGTGKVLDNGKLADFTVKKGDTILLSPACASFDAYSDFEARGRHFTDLARAPAPSQSE